MTEEIEGAPVAVVFNTELLDPRRAGAVTRWHTWYRLQEQPVADHCWNLARIILAVWPDAPREMLVHALMHDIGEGVCGDVPYPIKRSSPTLKTAFNQLEHDTHLKMCIPWGVPSPVKLEAPYQVIFKLCEFMEMWEWTLHERSMGNKHAVLPCQRCWQQIEHLISKVANIDYNCSNNANLYVKRRGDLFRHITGEEP